MMTTVTEQSFVDAFDEYNRSNNFSREGRRALFSYLEEYEDSAGEQIELDVIALCCEYTEYDSALDAAKEYGYEEGVDLEPHGDVDLLEVAELEEKQALEWLEDRTTVIPLEGNGGVIIQNF